MATPRTNPKGPEHARRRYELLQVLIRRGEISTLGAAQHLQVSRRTALNDLKALSRDGVPLHTEGEGRARRWVLAASWRVLGAEIGLMHRVATLLGRQLLGSFLHHTTIADALGELERRIWTLGGGRTDGTPIEDRRLHYQPRLETDYSAQGDLIARIIDALHRNRRVDMRYRSASRGEEEQLRAVCPLTLVVYKRALYLIADLGRSFRIFALDRIDDLQVLDLRFDYPRPAEYDPARLLAGRFGITSGDAPPETVRLRFAPSVAPYARRRRWMPGQTLETEPDGSLLLTFEATGKELLPPILEWGETVEVLAPPWLREKVAAVLEKAARRYPENGCSVPGAGTGDGV